jgi:hypothetical protein
VLVVVGATTYTSAHAVDSVEIDGHVANYTEILIGTSYAHNELRLTGDPHTYVLDSRQFHPSLPDRFGQDARISIWVDRGTTNVVALTLYDVMGLNPVTYTTPNYDDPTTTLRAAQTQGGAMAGAGLVLVLLVPIGLLIARLRRRGRAQEDSAIPGVAWRRAGPLEPQPAPMPFERTATRSSSTIPSARTSAAPFISTSADSAPWSSRTAPSEWSRPGVHTSLPGVGPLAGASSLFPADRASDGWPPSAGEPGAVPGWDIDELPTQKRPAQHVPSAPPPFVDELPTQKTRTHPPTDEGNPPPARPS